VGVCPWCLSILSVLGTALGVLGVLGAEVIVGALDACLQ
jgi:hypothetical protein